MVFFFSGVLEIYLKVVASKFERSLEYLKTAMFNQVRKLPTDPLISMVRVDIYLDAVRFPKKAGIWGKNFFV